MYCLAIQLESTVEEVEFDQKRQADEIAADASDQPRRRPCRAARCEDVVYDQHAVTGAKRVLVNLEAVNAVLERVLLALGLRRELPRLANRDEAGIQPAGDRGAQDEAPALDADHVVDALTCIRGCERSHHFTKSVGVVQERRNVVEQNPRLREIGNVPNLGFEMFHVGQPSVDRKS